MNDSSMIKAIEFMPSTPPGNPFWHDQFHMGTHVGDDLAVMFPDMKNTPYIILVNITTGERVKLWLDLTPQPAFYKFNPEYFYSLDSKMPVVFRKHISQIYDDYAEEAYKEIMG